MIYGYHKTNKGDKYRHLIWKAGAYISANVNKLKEFTNERKKAYLTKVSGK